MTDSIPRRLKSAVFVDFDNIYLGLENLDANASRAFASNPGTWLTWLESGMPTLYDYGDEELVQRDLLVRRCYLNPALIGRSGGDRDVRAHFIRTGFSVVDCPAIASRKNTADILMVMDILDAIAHPTRFDEFIIFSGDSDFTPVLLRLRAHDRRTSIITAGPAAEAYRAAADRAIPPDLFMEFGLAIVQAEDPSSDASLAQLGSIEPLLDKIAAAVHLAARTSGELGLNTLLPVFKQFNEFRRSLDWLGFGKSRALAAAVAARRADLAFINSDPWVITLVNLEPVSSQPPSKGEGRDLAPASEGQGIDAARVAAVDIATRCVQHASEPVTMAAVAHEVRKQLGATISEDWAGAGTFKALLQSAGSLPFEMITAPGIPGYLYDPRRHQRPSTEREQDSWHKDEPGEFVEFVKSVSQVTGAPALSPRQYRLVFELIASEVEANGYSFLGTSKAVRDRCLEAGESIARQAISFVLRGIVFAGQPLRQERVEPAALADAFRRNVENLCRASQLDVADSGARMQYWLGGVRLGT